jgi:hypothetical protein
MPITLFVQKNINPIISPPGKGKGTYVAETNIILAGPGSSVMKSPASGSKPTRFYLLAG